MSDLESNVKSVYQTARELAEDLGKLGKSWIRYGLTVSESSMQASAHTLDEAAEALRKVAERLRADG
ncbi:MAG TPA: hypothetical protein VF945_09790 [Polyangia bacterium]